MHRCSITSYYDDTIKDLTGLAYNQGDKDEKYYGRLIKSEIEGCDSVKHHQQSMILPLNG